MLVGGTVFVQHQLGYFPFTVLIDALYHNLLTYPTKFASDPTTLSAYLSLHISLAPSRLAVNLSGSMASSWDDQ